MKKSKLNARVPLKKSKPGDAERAAVADAAARAERVAVADAAARAEKLGEEEDDDEYDSFKMKN